MYLIGIIPGPTKPSIDQINHFLRLVVDDLLVLWNPGVRYKRTPKYKFGRLFRAALIPLICDILAAKQVTGLGAHGSKFFCSFCYLTLDHIEDFDRSKWPERDLRDHILHAEQWRDAMSAQERKDLFDLYGIRWTELLRLPYWDPIRYTVVDSMHNLYLGLLKNHCRDIWGIDVDVLDGDAATHPTKKPPRFPARDEWAEGLQTLYHGTIEELGKCRKAVLWHLCDKNDLRRAGAKRQLTRTLNEWANTTQDVGSGGQNGNPHISEYLGKDIVRAEASLARGSNPSTIKKYKKPVLIQICTRRALATTGTCSDLAERLCADQRTRPVSTQQPHELLLRFVYQYRQASESPAANSTGKVKHYTTSTVALGRQSLDAFLVVREAMELPSWVNPAPKGFGTTEFGKLSADQWHTTCTIVLPVALIWAWGEGEPRRQAMLANFLDLVSAVVLAGLLELSEANVKRYDMFMRRYLEGLKTLYKEGVIKPNHHYALHLPDFMRLFAAVHSWRAFGFERLNYNLQGTNTNLKFGEMEATFTKAHCRAANVRPVVHDNKVGHVMQEFIDVLNKQSGEDVRGMRLDAILRSHNTPHDDPAPRTSTSTQDSLCSSKKPKETFLLDDDCYDVLLTMLNREVGRLQYVDGPPENTIGRLRLPHAAIRVPKLFISGVFYHSCRSAPRNSNILFTHPASAEVRAGFIKDIFVHSRPSLGGTSTVEETYLAVSGYVELSPTDLAQDKFRKFPIAGGRLVYARTDPRVYIVRPSQIVCHFAKTKLQVTNITAPCIHVLPLDRVSVHITLLQNLLSDHQFRSSYASSLHKNCMMWTTKSELCI
ncbi:hypothetical protein OH76DRAFT_1367271 [Lentinus brumalis]|uniref:Uncharacterized protein n=1 Tax=Lentinus brumalis TaxID=2498619 RepID=A0A371CHC6_9APHY|nr:hypothetical protein OH76DRAFT_1367271 [Polyporus brumalis]